ncbi:MAG: hypothetical protein LQ346_001933 [Caloplaca aetnensis]|nr:MAG: hypothetical protein LQ346_001933 [Caloplaca aetnensis]
MVRNPLMGLTIAATGDFGSGRGHEKLKQWVEKNGGQWAIKMSEDVTHLICTKEDYRIKAPMVKHALRLKMFNIVTYDWLEDSLIKRYRLAPKGEYLVARAIKDAKKVKQVRKQAKKEVISKGGAQVPSITETLRRPIPTYCTVESFKKECQDIQAQLFSDRYHVYRDSTFFAYDVSLVRVNLLQNKSERYVLRYFAALLTYHTRDAPVHKSILAPKGSDWTAAFAAFTKTFAAKTKVDWDERLVPRRSWAEQEGAFVYTPPKEGEPRGEVAEDFVIAG